jgi:hypothetical protein
MITQFANCIIASFGYGDIGIGAGLSNGIDYESWAVFTDIEPGTIGRDIKNDGHLFENSRIRLTFDNVESLDVIIEVLTELKTLMLNKQ